MMSQLRVIVTLLACCSCSSASECSAPEADDDVSLLQRDTVVARRSSGLSHVSADNEGHNEGHNKGHNEGSLAKASIPPPVAPHIPVLSKAMIGNSTDIWNGSIPWAKFTERHPPGVASNVWFGITQWAPVNYLNVRMLYIISGIAYPVVFLFLIMCIMFLVSISLSVEDAEKAETHSYLPNLDCGQLSTSPGKQNVAAKRRLPSVTGYKIKNSKGYSPHHKSEEPPEPVPPPCGEDYGMPVVKVAQLTPASQQIYLCYSYFCRTIPCIMVFGVPATLAFLFFPFPQEMFAVLALITSVAVFSNGVYMCVFGGFTIWRLRDALRNDPGANARTRARTIGDSPEACSEADLDKQRIVHWVILPQYMEDVEVVSMSLMSMSMSSIARTSISVVLAMEQREETAEAKATELKRRFNDSFAEIMITYHPPNLPNDPAGKSANTKWAFEHLLPHLWASGQDFSDVMLTVADADSDFHECYFEELVNRYLEQPAEERNLHIFQAAILHIKNYHRQPSPVAVGTMFTSMQELAVMGDPNATQFPYSTYSLSLELVRRVGGFDAEWIAEDWHMGIKCYLLTLGHSRVVPILLPICNTTPEDMTWSSTIHARWSQAKRHALGFSDIAYYFMMLPLMYAHVSSKSSESRARYIQAFWGVAINGLRVVIRIVSVHVVIGVITTYGILEFLFGLFMKLFMHSDRHVDQLWERTFYWFRGMFIATMIFMLIVATMFNILYTYAKDRVEKEEGSTSLVFRNGFMHWLYTAFCFLAFGPFYFAALAYAVWRASILVLSTKALDYEVAPKIVLSKSEYIQEKKAPAKQPEQAETTAASSMLAASSKPFH